MTDAVTVLLQVGFFGLFIVGCVSLHSMHLLFSTSRRLGAKSVAWYLISIAIDTGSRRGGLLSPQRSAGWDRPPHAVHLIHAGPCPVGVFGARNPPPPRMISNNNSNKISQLKNTAVTVRRLVTAWKRGRIELVHQ